MAIPHQSNNNSKLERELKNLEEEHQLTSFLGQYGLKILGSLGLLFLILTLFFFFTGRHETASESDFIQAENNFVLVKRHLTATSDSNEDTAWNSLDKLAALIQRYPQLNSRYDGPLAQLLLSSGHPDRALPYAQSLLKRANSPALLNYQAFGQITLEQSQTYSEKTLQQAQALENKITPSEKRLALFNSLYIASLTTNPASWQILKDKLSRDKAKNELTYQKFASLLHDGDVSIAQYLEFKTNPITVE